MEQHLADEVAQTRVAVQNLALALAGAHIDSLTRQQRERLEVLRLDCQWLAAVAAKVMRTEERKPRKRLR